MTFAFLPSHYAVPVTPATPSSGNGAAMSVSAQQMMGGITGNAEAERVESKMQVSEQAKKGIRVLVVDDHEIVRKGLCALLNEQDDFEVVGQAASGNLAITLAIQLQPDIVLLDIFLGASNGLDIAQQLQRGCPRTRIVV